MLRHYVTSYHYSTNVFWLVRSSILNITGFSLANRCQNFDTCDYIRKESLLKNMCSNMYKREKHVVWNPWNYFTAGAELSQYVVIILNRPIHLHFQPNFILNLWNQAALRVTVDGGTNRWLSWLKLNSYDHQKITPPDLITGDMDSVSKDTLHTFIKRKATNIIKTEDQNETDYTKALRIVKQHIADNNLQIDTIFVLCDTSGRFDQIIANVNTLFKAKNILPDAKIYQLASNSLTWLLTEGKHSLNIPLSIRENNEWCALMPIGMPCKVTTCGLKWNLNNSLLEFGKLVSTSNTYSGEPIVTIQTDNPLVWSMGIESLL